MKKLIIAASVMLAALATSYGQGTVDFFNGSTINAPVFDTDGTTKLGTASGAMAALFAGHDDASLHMIGSAVPFNNNLQGQPNGFFKITAADRARAVDDVPLGGNASVQVRAWKGGADFASSSVKGTSAILHIKTGGDLNAVGVPNPPAAMTGLQSFQLVPEPSTIALGVMGVAALLIRRRK